MEENTAVDSNVTQNVQGRRNALITYAIIADLFYEGIIKEELARIGGLLATKIIRDQIFFQKVKAKVVKDLTKEEKDECLKAMQSPTPPNEALVLARIILRKISEIASRRLGSDKTGELNIPNVVAVLEATIEERFRTGNNDSTLEFFLQKQSLAGTTFTREEIEKEAKEVEYSNLLVAALFLFTNKFFFECDPEWKASYEEFKKTGKIQ